ncbi:MAG: sulfotransferase [Pseudomonadota bacterium]
METQFGGAGITNPRHDELVERGRNLLVDNKYQEAEICIQSVLRENPRHPEALHVMGLFATAVGRPNAAVDYLTKATTLVPNNAVYQNNLGNALTIAKLPQKALPHLKKAIKLDRKYAKPVYNLGRAYKAIGEVEKAEKYFNRALKVDPDYHHAQAALAELAVQSGKLEIASGMFEQILKSDPDNIQAMSGLAISRKTQAEDPHLPLVRRRVEDPQLDDTSKVILHHALGKMLNDIGDYEDAIHQFTLGKQTAALSFNMDHHRKTYGNLRELYVPDFFAKRQGFGVNDERPVFIIGMPRSGTTLTEQIIASHGLVDGLGERPEIREFGRRLKFGQGNPSEHLEAVSNLKEPDIRQMANEYFGLYKQAKRGAKRISDKHPHNYEMLGLIALMFPKAKIIHCRRDPMDTCVSCYMQNFKRSHSYTGDLATLGQYYIEYSRLMDHWRENLPLEMLELQYEDMIADQEATSRQLIDFLGLEWDEACLNYFETKRSVETPSRWQVRQPIYNSSVGRWRRYEKELGPLKQALGDLFVT